MRFLYRAGQFWKAFTVAPDPEDLALAQEALSPPLLALFLCLQASEQAHSLWILRCLYEQNQTDHDLLVAALLHDVGKSCHPLRLWERVVIVLGRAYFPEQAKIWGNSEPRGWKRPFVVAEKHAAWGAELAAQAGATPLTVAIIKRHQELPHTAPTELVSEQQALLEDCLLHQLQIFDEES